MYNSNRFNFVLRTYIENKFVDRCVLYSITHGEWYNHSTLINPRFVREATQKKNLVDSKRGEG